MGKGKKQRGRWGVEEEKKTVERGKKKGNEEPGSPRADGEREKDLLGLINRRQKVIYFVYVLKVRRIVWNPKPSYLKNEGLLLSYKYQQLPLSQFI